MKKLSRWFVTAGITLAAILFWVSFLVTTCAPKKAFPAEVVQKYLIERDYRVIKEHWQDYKYAADLTGVPILLLPAIHYREAHLFTGWYSHKRKEVVKNIGGPFMLDLGPLNDGVEFERRIRAYEKRCTILMSDTTKTFQK